MLHKQQESPRSLKIPSQKQRQNLRPKQILETATKYKNTIILITNK